MKGSLGFIMVLIFSLLVSGLVRGALPEDLAFLMMFDEGKGDVVADLSDFGNDGEVNGKADWIQGKYGGAFNLDGVTFINVPNAKPLDELTHPMSVGCWVSPDELGGWRNIVEMDAEGQGGWKMGYHDSHAIVWTTYRVQDFISQTPIPLGEWTHVCATWDGTEAIVYINGEPDAPIPGGGVIDTTGLPSLDIGRRRTTDASYGNGGIDELFIFTKVLEQDEITEFMKGFADIVSVDPQSKLSTTWGALKL